MTNQKKKQQTTTTSKTPKEIHKVENIYIHKKKDPLHFSE